MVRKYEVRGTELGGDAFYEDWVEVVRYEDYAKLEAELSGLKEWRAQVIDVALKASEEARAKIDNLEAELQKYKDQFPDYVECANCGYVTHVEGVEDAIGQSGCRKEDVQECEHVWNRYIVHPHRKICLVCGVKE